MRPSQIGPHQVTYDAVAQLIRYGVRVLMRPSQIGPHLVTYDAVARLLRPSHIGPHHIIDEALVSKSIAIALDCACYDMRKD
eukprot:scaffold5304_cov150-Skeletonema_marinoi.AAC.8